MTDTGDSTLQTVEEWERDIQRQYQATPGTESLQCYLNLHSPDFKYNHILSVKKEKIQS